MRRAFSLLVPLTCVLALAPAVAEAKPKFRNGMSVEAQGPDGRWYRAKVWKVKKGSPPQYELRFEGMPSSARQWLAEDKLRPSGGGAVVDPAAIKAVIDAKQQFQRVVAHGKQGKWTNERWNRDLDTLVNQLEAKVKAIQSKWPQEPLGNLPGLPAKLRANAELRRKEHGAAQAAKSAQASQPGEGAQLEAAYRKAAKAADNFPYDLSPKNLVDYKASFEDLDLAATEARIAKDSARFPAVFAYYGREDPAKYGEMKYGGPKAPQIADKDLKRVHQFYLPKIFQIKARLKGKEQVLADTVSFAMKRGKSVDDALVAVQLGEAIRRCLPNNTGLEAQIKAAQALVETRLQAFAPLMKGPFHRQHLRQLVAFSSRQTLGQEQAGQVVQELTPGQPLYLIGYLTESVKDIGFRRRDSKLGFETTRLPDLKFRLKGTKDQPFRLPVYSKVQGKELSKVGAVVIDLQPDPSTTYASHFAYLPALHFTRWLLDLKPGSYTLEFSATASLQVDPSKNGAHGELKLTVTPETKAQLKAYYDALWAKKLSTVVYPDDYGVRDRKGEIPNADHLAKFGKLLKLTCAQTNKVMKPFPNQHQIKNFVGAGYGLFEKEGRYLVIPLGFVRKPEEPVLRWSTVRGTPDDYALRGPREYLPTVLEHGYELPQANLAKTGSW